MKVDFFTEKDEISKSLQAKDGVEYIKKPFAIAGARGFFIRDRNFNIKNTSQITNKTQTNFFIISLITISAFSGVTLKSEQCLWAIALLPGSFMSSRREKRPVLRPI